MRVSRLFVYPIKSLQGVEVDSARATKHGFPYDRVFMLFKVMDEAASDPAKRYQKMSLDRFNEMVLFAPVLQYPDEKQDGSITVTFNPPQGQKRSITVPLVPEVEDLESFEVDLHKSCTTGYRMEQHYNDWFSACLGYQVVLVYLGENLRPVLFKLNPRTANISSWLGYLTGGYLGSVSPRLEQITFADCAAYLIVSETSNAAVSKMLPPDQPMDVRKFRPNIVISGADEEWEEDYWAELQFAPKNPDGRVVSITLERNCVRCQSINVDYQTGKLCTNESGQVLKLLQKHRRVDVGHKWSPVFGRYSFLKGIEGSIFVGDEVTVTRRNTERDVHDWKS